jgi:hypothetical protein
MQQNKGEENIQSTTKKHLNNFSFFFKWITTLKKNSKFKILEKWQVFLKITQIKFQKKKSFPQFSSQNFSHKREKICYKRYYNYFFLELVNF